MHLLKTMAHSEVAQVLHFPKAQCFLRIFPELVLEVSCFKQNDGISFQTSMTGDGLAAIFKQVASVMSHFCKNNQCLTLFCNVTNGCRTACSNAFYAVERIFNAVRRVVCTSQYNDILGAT